MGNLWNDLKHSLYMVLKNPGFAMVAVAILAVGIGANTAIFTIVDAVLLKPLAYPNADRVVQVLQTSPSGNDTNTSIPEFHNWQQQTSIFAEIAAYDRTGPGFNIASDGAGDRPEQVHGIHVTESYFRLFGAPVVLGRTFTPEEDSPNGGRVIILSYYLWQRKFGGDPSAIGKLLWLGREPYRVIGVLGKQFVSDPEAEIWIPFQLEHSDTNRNHFFQVAGLLKPGITLAEANANMSVAAVQFLRANHEQNSRQSFAVQPLRDSIIGDASRSLLLLWAAVSLVLLIACANVANLLLVRATGRKREFAIRSALGAGRWRIIRQLLTESVLLSITGGILGIVLGFIGVRALLTISPEALPRIGAGGSGVDFDWRVLAFTLAVSLVTGILFGLFPAFSASHTDLNSSLKESSTRSGMGFRQSKSLSLLIIVEVSLALVLLISSALLIRTSFALSNVSPGFDSHHVLTLEMSLTGHRYQKTEAVAQLSREGCNRLNAIPGVESSAAAFWLPIDVVDGLPFQVIGRLSQEGSSRWMSTSPGYLSVFKMPLVRGRDINEHDVAGSPPIVLINQALANQYFPKENPIGKQIIIGQGMGPEVVEAPREIVGVVADTHNHGLDHRSEPMVIVPLAQVTDGYNESYTDFQPLLWVVRTHGDPHQAISAISEQLRLASGGFLVAHVRSMDEVMGASTAREHFTLLLFMIFGAVALFLAAIGIYGVMAYSVAQRAHEIGTRMALGADRGAIRHLVVWRGMKLAIIGIAIGMLAAFGVAHLIAGFLFGVEPWDPVAFLSAPVILCGITLVAVWLPATRASRVDPVQVLRAE